MRGARRSRGPIAIASTAGGRPRRSRRCGAGGTRGRATRRRLPSPRTCSAASTTFAPLRRPRRSIRSSSASSRARSGTGATTRSSSRSPRTASSATWFGRLWGRCSSESPPSSRRSSRAATAATPERRRRPGASTSSPSGTNQPMAAPALKDVQARLDELRAELNHHRYRYHVLDDPEISDAEYDRLYDELKALEEDHPDLITPDSPTQRLGAPPSDTFQKFEHRTPMGSLDKVTDDEGLRKWADDVRKRLDSDEPVAYVIEPKID